MVIYFNDGSHAECECVEADMYSKQIIWDGCRFEDIENVLAVEEGEYDPDYFKERSLEEND